MRVQKEARLSLFRRVRIPLLTAVAVVITAFFVIPLLFELLDLTPQVVEVSTAMANADPAPTPTPALTQELEATAGPTETQCPYTTLQFGDTAGIVKDIQSKLMELGYVDADEPTDYFGPATEAALKRFQRVHHMTETGIADPLTQELLFSDQAAPYSIHPGDSGEDVESVQKRLYELGYEVEKRNGYFGAATQQALLSFQTKNKITVSGEVDPGTWELIFSSAAKPKVDPTPTPTPRKTATPKPPSTAKSTAGTGTTKTAAPTSGSSSGGIPVVGSGAADLIATAMAQVGDPYIWSTEGPDSFDCSGLVYFSLRSVGISVGRMSAKGFSEISSWQTIEGAGNLQPGDLIFFRSDTSSSISHTGIWLGNNKYVHASSSAGKVTVSSWSDWANRNFSHGKRVF